MSWGRRLCLNIKSLKEMANLVQELTSRLQRFGITEITGVHRVKWTNAEASVILKCVIAGKISNNILRSFLPSKVRKFLQVHFIRIISCVCRTTKKLIVMLSSRWAVVIQKRPYFSPVSIRSTLVNCTRLTSNDFSNRMALPRRTFAFRLKIRMRRFSLRSSRTIYLTVVRPTNWLKWFPAKW